MNGLDIAVVRNTIQAAVPVTIVVILGRACTSSGVPLRATSEHWLRKHNFPCIDMPGTHRYQTTEMSELAGALFLGDRFQVLAPEEGEEFDVVLGHDWGALWTEQRVSILPAGIPSKIDGGSMASAFVLLVNEVVRALFGIEASGLAEATRALEPVDPVSQLAEPLKLLRDVDATDDDVWNALRDAFQPPDAEGGLSRR